MTTSRDPRIRVPESAPTVPPEVPGVGYCFQLMEEGIRTGYTVRYLLVGTMVRGRLCGLATDYTGGGVFMTTYVLGGWGLNGYCEDSCPPDIRRLARCLMQALCPGLWEKLFEVVRLFIQRAYLEDPWATRLAVRLWKDAPEGYMVCSANPAPSPVNMGNTVFGDAQDFREAVVSADKERWIECPRAWRRICPNPYHPPRVFRRRD